MKRNLIILLGITALVFCGCRQSAQPKISGDKIREYANELYGRYLFDQALTQYRYYRDNYTLNPDEQANITFRIANIYFDRLNDYENALAEFLRIKTIYPESKTIPEVNKKVIACLERLQRPEDARQALQESTDLEPRARESRPGEVIAVIGERQITQGDLDFEINQFPPEIRSQYQDKGKKLEFLRRYVATELIYNSAQRQGLDKDKDVLENIFQAKKTFMVQKLLQQQISEQMKIEEEDIRLYYQAHRDQYAEKDKDDKIIRQRALSEVQQRVAQDLAQERQIKAYEDLISSYLRAENVKIFDDLVK